MLTPDSLSGLYRWHNAEKTTAISLALYDYHYFQAQADANDVPYFTMSNDQLFDNPNASGSLYAQSTVFMAGPHETRTKSRFILPSQMFFSNIANVGQVTVEVDFGNGGGWQAVSFDQEYPIGYSETGEKTIKVKLTANSSAYYCTFKVEVTEAASGTENHLYDAMWDDPNSSAEAHILYGTGNNSKIMRPVIFVEGFDFLDLFDEDDLFRIMNGPGREFDPNGLVRQLQTNGYDVIILNLLRRGGHSIPSNAQVLRRLIKWVNARKAANGSTHKNVVGGASMGGVISRYTLAKMEQEYCEDHETELYISYDSPHQGVYLPLSMQFLLKTSNRLSLGFVPDLRERMDEIRSPAAKQMFTAHIDNDGDPLPEHTLFYGELQNLGYPMQTRNISVSLGNSSNNQPTNNNGFHGVPYNAGQEIMRITGNGDCTWCTEVSSRNFSVVTNSNGTVSTLRVVFYLWKWFGARTSTVLVRRDFSFQSALERENVSGGYLLTHNETAEAVNGFLNESQATIPNNRLWHNLVSTPSAIDFISSPLVSSLNGETETQLVSNYDTPFNNILFDRNDRTSFHAGALQPNTTTFLLNEITQNIIPTTPRFLQQSISNATYNFGNPYFSKVPSVVIGANGIVKINHSANTGYGDGPYASQSHFDAYSGTGLCEGAIVIENGGQLIVGESLSKTANLFVANQTEVVIKSGGILKINDGSSLLIEDGANFIFEDGAQIELSGYGSVLKIQGKVTVGNNANFTFSGNGKLVFDQDVRWITDASGTYLNHDDYWDIGSNATFTVQGNTPVNYERHLILAEKPVYMRMEDGTTFSSVDIRNGRIALDDGALLGSFSPTQLHHVKVNGYTPSSSHRGFWLWNAGGTNTISNCKFKGGHKGLRMDWIGGGNAAIISNCTFENSGRGIEILRGPLRLYNSDFTGCNTGIYSDDAVGLSIINGCNLNRASVSSGIGIYFKSPQQGATFTVGNCDITGFTTGLHFQNTSVRSYCTEYSANGDEGIYFYDGILEIDHGAKNKFFSNANDIVFLGPDATTGILLLQGENDFEARGRTDDGQYISGLTWPGAPLGEDPIVADNNKMPTYRELNGPITMRVNIQDENYNQIDIRVDPNPATVPNCNGGSSSGSGYVTAYGAVQGFSTAGGSVSVQGFSGTLQAAALDALQHVSVGENTYDDLLALQKINRLLLTTVSDPDGNTEKIKAHLYYHMHTSLNQAFQYGGLQHTENGTAVVLDEVEDVATIIDNRMAGYNPSDSATFALKFRATLDKVHAYRVSGYYDLALGLLYNAGLWTFSHEQSMRAGYWQCACEAERMYFDEEIGPEELGTEIDLCKQQYAGYTQKRVRAHTGKGTPVQSPVASVKNIYPQPVASELIVELTLPGETAIGYRITDISGKLLQKGQVLPEGDQLQFQVESLPAGVYFLALEMAGKNEVVKFSKE